VTVNSELNSKVNIKYIPALNGPCCAENGSQNRRTKQNKKHMKTFKIEEEHKINWRRFIETEVKWGNCRVCHLSKSSSCFDRLHYSTLISSVCKNEVLNDSFFNFLFSKRPNYNTEKKKFPGTAGLIKRMRN